MLARKMHADEVDADATLVALEVEHATWACARAWALSQSLIALSYSTPETNPVLVLEARRWPAEVLA